MPNLKSADRQSHVFNAVACRLLAAATTQVAAFWGFGVRLSEPRYFRLHRLNGLCQFQKCGGFFLFPLLFTVPTSTCWWRCLGNGTTDIPRNCTCGGCILMGLLRCLESVPRALELCLCLFQRGKSCFAFLRCRLGNASVWWGQSMHTIPGLSWWPLILVWGVVLHSYSL